MPNTRRRLGQKIRNKQVDAPEEYAFNSLSYGSISPWSLFPQLPILAEHRLDIVTVNFAESPPLFLKQCETPVSLSTRFHVVATHGGAQPTSVSPQ